MPAVLDLVTIGAPDPAPIIGFYDAALGPLGLVRLGELVDEEDDAAEVEAAGWGAQDGEALLWVVTSALPTSGVHIRLRVADASQVERCHRAALGHGGRTHAAPRRWTLYRRGEFGAGVFDPLGNLLEVVAPE